VGRKKKAPNGDVGHSSGRATGRTAREHREGGEGAYGFYISFTCACDIPWSDCGGGYGRPVCIPFAFALRRGLTRYSIHLLPASPPASPPPLKSRLTFPELNVLPACLPAIPLKSHRPSNSPSYDSLPYQPPNHLISKLAEPVTKLPPISTSAASHVHQCVSVRGLKVWRSSAAKSGEELGGWEPAQSAR
jgi:hypothetical protein